jgi:hypothetical protein
VHLVHRAGDRLRFAALGAGERVQIANVDLVGSAHAACRRDDAPVERLAARGGSEVEIAVADFDRGLTGHVCLRRAGQQADAEQAECKQRSARIQSRVHGNLH